jgi:putative nucleotidyltransferase with HDIG domain
VDDLPIEESRRLVAARTGRIGYPDAHAIAVAECSLRIADSLALEPEQRKTICTGALLHDVGKLQIEEEILSKPGPLTLDERRKIQRHPVEGEQMIGEAVDEQVAEVVLNHHERWDGSGYPNGLSGTQIPLAARVVAVADAYLAMREARPYRVRLTKTEAVRELVAGSGTQFDPVCVDALVSLVASG